MKKLSVLFTFIMVIAVMSCMMIPSFADEVTDVTVETTADDATVTDATVETTADEETDAAVADTTPETEAAEEDHSGHDHNGNGDGWLDLGVSEFIAIAVAVVLLVGAVTAILLLAPKKTKQK